MSQPQSNDLVRVREQFEHWRSERSGRGRIPDRLWRAAVSLLEMHAASTVCRALRLSASELKKRRQALAAAPDASHVAAPTFVELHAVDLAPTVKRSASDLGTNDAPVRLELTRPDGAQLALEVPSTQWARVEALCAAFLRG